MTVSIHRDMGKSYPVSARPRRVKTSRRIRMRSVMTPSTPRSSSSSIVLSSLIVQTCTAKCARWAASTNRLVTIRTGPCRIGTWTQSAPRRGIAPHIADRRVSATAPGPIDVHARPRPSVRIRRRRRSENEPTQTRSHTSRRSSSAASGPTQASDLGSMLIRTDGHRSRTSSKRGTPMPRPRNGKLCPPSTENA